MDGRIKIRMDLFPFVIKIRRSFYVQETCGDIMMLIKDTRLAFVSVMDIFNAFESEYMFGYRNIRFLATFNGSGYLNIRR